MLYAETVSMPDHSPFDHLEINDLFDIAADPDRIEWKPFRDGVLIHRLYGDGVSGPTAAILRFHKEATVPLHVHEGYEHLLILAGNQRDANGILRPGTLRIHPPGSRHSATSEAGCMVLAIYEKAVRFIED
jgi:anti-sigma factor ChrR (cupin superfamily)